MASEEVIKRVIGGFRNAEINTKQMMEKGYFSCEPYKGFLEQFKNLGCWFEALVMMTDSPEEVDEDEALKLIEAYEYFNDIICPSLVDLSEDIIQFERLLKGNSIQE